MKNINRIELTREQFEQNTNYIKDNFKTADGHVYPITESGNAGYILQENNFSLTDTNGNITMFYVKEA